MNPYQTVYEALRERLLSAGEIGEGFIGCTLEEIASIERAFGRPLPASYRAFLKVMGRQAGSFMVGTDCFYAHVKDQIGRREGMLDLHGGAPVLPDTAFIYLSHQGYVYCWFDATGGDDPECVCIEEGGDCEPSGKTITQWFHSAAEDHIALVQARR